MTTIAKNLEQIKAGILDACLKADRPPKDINLLAVSKTQPTSAVREALDAGQIHFGENYLQDAIPKVLEHPDAVWHFIGAIQSNKTREIANHFSWVHSVSSHKIGRRLAEQRDPALGPLKILIQVNVSGEESKSGVAPEEAERLAGQLISFDGISLQGLMAIPEATSDAHVQQQRFASVRQLRDRISNKYQISLPQLSMGMTADYPMAISEGATWIRIGTAIFGPRKKSPT